MCNSRKNVPCCFQHLQVLKATRWQFISLFTDAIFSYSFATCSGRLICLHLFEFYKNERNDPEAYSCIEKIFEIIQLFMRIHGWILHLPQIVSIINIGKVAYYGEFLSNQASEQRRDQDKYDNQARNRIHNSGEVPNEISDHKSDSGANPHFRGLGHIVRRIPLQT